MPSNTPTEDSHAPIAAYAMQWAIPDFKSARTRARLTQAELAKRVGITQSQISRFEAGKAHIEQDVILRIIRQIIQAQEEADALRAKG